MSRLRDLVPSPIEIALEDGQTLTVRPLSLKSISMLLELHVEEVKFILSQDFENVDWQGLIVRSPDFIGDVIAIAAGEFNAEGRELATQLVLDLQVEILLRIWKASFPSPKKLQSLLAEVLGNQNLSLGVQP